jgi:class 3 adenylate cyclase
VKIEFDVALPPRQVWDVIADTQHVNEIFYKTPAVQLLSTDGQVARLRGTYGFIGPEYDEYPWEFEVPNRFHLVRKFTRGVLKLNDVQARLTETADGTHVEYTNAIETSRSPLAAIVRVGFRWQVRKALARLKEFVVGLVPDQAIEWPPANPYASVTIARAEPFVASLRRDHPGQGTAIDQLVGYVATAPDHDVGRMRPYELADKWSLARDEALELFLQATRAGLLQLSWDILCPSCENPSTAVTRLADLPQGESHCPACDIDFGTSFDESVEATFSPSPGVREVSQGVYCFGSPQHTPNWLAQFVVEPGDERVLETELSVGRYRVQAAGVDGRALLEVVDDDDDELAVKLTSDDGARPEIGCERPRLGAGKVRIRVANDDERARRVQLVHRRLASSAVLAPDITSLGTFRDLFTDDVLAPGQSLQVGRTVILFTDLVGSTAMYERVGDATAYSLVRRHFEIMEKAIADHGGRIVKTIGDAVMASFPRALDAVLAGWDGIVGVRAMAEQDRTAPELALKVGVHVGPCLAVEANQASDYFGRTVNIAARVQGLAGADEIVLSNEVRESAGVAAWVEAVTTQGADAREDSKPIKGVAGEIEVLRVKLRDGPATVEMQAAADPDDVDPERTMDDRGPRAPQTEADRAPPPEETLVD